MSGQRDKGVRRRLSPARRFINDLVHFAQKVPSIPVARATNIASVVAARQATRPRPSWTAVFMRAYALVAQRRSLLRQAYVRWPWSHLYEHPYSVCGLAIEREWGSEQVLLATQIRAPEKQSLRAIDAHLERYKKTPVAEIGYYRMAMRLGRMPLPIRRLLWWSTLNLSGYKRAKRLGTFGVSSYGRLGAEQLHPIGPLTTLLTFGPVSPAGDVVVKLIYDHRVMDGSNVARYLAELEQTLKGEILAELQAMAQCPEQVDQQSPHDRIAA